MNRFVVPTAHREHLMQLARDLPQPALTAESLDSGVREQCVSMLQSRGEPWIAGLMSRVRSSLRADEMAQGYIVIDAIPSVAADQPEALRLATALCCLAGVPFRVIDDGGLWQTIDVDLNVAPHRFRGTGHNPLHIDVVNSTDPPDSVVLFCIRVDPAGGGQTLVSNVQSAVRRLPAHVVAQLERPVFREGQFYGMSGVGRELNPFPVLEAAEHPLWRVRFTAKMIPEMQPGLSRNAVMALAEALEEQQECFRLERGELLILNQRIVAHGRLPLGAGQHEIAPALRRYLRQTYLHGEHLAESS